jgi:hypothetical protein
MPGVLGALAIGSTDERVHGDGSMEAGAIHEDDGARGGMGRERARGEHWEQVEGSEMVKQARPGENGISTLVKDAAWSDSQNTVKAARPRAMSGLPAQSRDSRQLGVPTQARTSSRREFRHTSGLLT